MIDHQHPSTIGELINMDPTLSMKNPFLTLCAFWLVECVKFKETYWLAKACWCKFKFTYIPNCIFPTAMVPQINVIPIKTDHHGNMTATWQHVDIRWTLNYDSYPLRRFMSIVVVINHWLLVEYTRCWGHNANRNNQSFEQFGSTWWLSCSHG